jgi:UBX domain-containing protein 1/4
MKELAKKRKEKQDELDAKQRIRAKIAADKEERRLKAEREKAERAGQPLPPQPAASPPAQTSGPVTSKPASVYSETRLRFQTQKGNIIKTFPVDTTLFEVATALNVDDGIDVQSFTQNFPKKVFDAEYFGDTLKEVGLVPSANLIVN